MRCVMLILWAMVPAWLGADDKRLPEGVVLTDSEERIRRYRFDSAALMRKMALTVVYPAGYEATGKRWPVLFFLHGLGRNETTLVGDPGSRETLLAQPYVIVLPKGENGWYFDSPFDARRQYARYLDEVVALAGKVAHVSSERSQRAIGGWSAGGFGAVWACLRQPESFSTLATIMAVVDFPTQGARFPISKETFGTDPARWPEFNPMPRAEQLRGLNILLVIGETASDAAMNERFSSRLKSAGIDHETLRLPGGHTFPTVQAGVGPVCDFARKHLAPR